MNSLISFQYFSGEPLRFPVFKTYQLQMMIFAYSVPVWVPVISLSCLITLARTLSVMFNKSDESKVIVVLFLI